MQNRNTRLQMVWNELRLSLEWASIAAQADEEGNAGKLSCAREEAQQALDSAVQTLAGVDGICETHLRPIRSKVSQAEKQLLQLRDTR